MKNINETVYSLNYKPEQVLAFKGNTVGNVEPKTGTLSNGKYIVVNREKRNRNLQSSFNQSRWLWYEIYYTFVRKRNLLI